MAAMPNSGLPGAEGPPTDQAKMIVFGVSFSTTKEGFREYWAQYGELAECELMFGRDGRSRGFGFVLYRDEALNKRIMTMQHSLDGRSLDIKAKDENVANAKHAGASGHGVPFSGSAAGGVGGVLPPLSKTKIFVGRLLDDVEPDDLRQYFEQYGTVVDVFMPTVHATGKRKNVGFVEFASAENCAQVLNEPKHIVKNGDISVQAAAPKNERFGDRFGAGAGAGGGYGGFDRGRGGYGGFNRDDFARDRGYGRERSPGRGGYERGMHEMMGMGGMGMGMGMGQMGGMDDMWRSMYEGMRQMYDGGSSYQQPGMAAMGGQYGAAAGAGAYGVPGISGVGQMGMQAAARDMYAGASTYGARQQPVYGGYGALANGVGNRIVIENLPRTIMWQGLKDLFKRFGNVSRADVFADGMGSVTYDLPNDARAASDGMNGYVLEGLQLRVRVEG